MPFLCFTSSADNAYVLLLFILRVFVLQYLMMNIIYEPSHIEIPLPQLCPLKHLPSFKTAFFLFPDAG
jgi:hypothetical protein